MMDRLIILVWLLYDEYVDWNTLFRKHIKINWRENLNFKPNNEYLGLILYINPYIPLYESSPTV